MRPEDRQPRWESCVTAFTFAGAGCRRGAVRLHGSLPRAGITALDTEETNNGQAEKREQSVAKAHHFKRSRKHGTTRVVCRFDTAFLFLGRKKGGARKEQPGRGDAAVRTVLFQERRSVVLRSTGGRKAHKITLEKKKTTPTPQVDTHTTTTTKKNLAGMR